MNSCKTVSKNRRRKSQRSSYYSAIHAFNQAPDDVRAKENLKVLIEQYCKMIDGRIDGIGAFSEDQCRHDEWVFINELLRDTDSNGWVSICTPEGIIQLKADINDYIKFRSSSGSQRNRLHAAAAQYLQERAFNRTRPVVIR